MTDTTTTQPRTDALTARMNREVLGFAISKQWTCPYSGEVLDVATAVLVEIPDNGSTLMAGSVLDQASAGVLAKHPGTDVIDGRTL